MEKQKKVKSVTSEALQLHWADLKPVKASFHENMTLDISLFSPEFENNATQEQMCWHYLKGISVLICFNEHQSRERSFTTEEMLLYHSFS